MQSYPSLGGEQLRAGPALHSSTVTALLDGLPQAPHSPSSGCSEVSPVSGSDSGASPSPTSNAGVSDSPSTATTPAHLATFCLLPPCWCALWGIFGWVFACLCASFLVPAHPHPSPVRPTAQRPRAAPPPPTSIRACEDTCGRRRAPLPAHRACCVWTLKCARVCVCVCKCRVQQAALMSPRPRPCPRRAWRSCCTASAWRSRTHWRTCAAFCVCRCGHLRCRCCQTTCRCVWLLVPQKCTCPDFPSCRVSWCVWGGGGRGSGALLGPGGLPSVL
jgi:hypothetical protein